MLFKRIITQVNTFLESYRIFEKFIFKDQPIKDYIMGEQSKLGDCKRIMEEAKKENPEAAQKADDMLH